MLFAATDVGVFDHKDGDPYWYKVSVGMPQVPVLDLKLNAAGTTLYAATFGRSVWKLPLTTDAVDGGGAGQVGGTVPATLSLSLGPPAQFGAVHAGRRRATYEAATTANVISSAGRRGAERGRPEFAEHRAPGQRLVLPAAAAAGEGAQRGQHGHGVQQRRLVGLAAEPARPTTGRSRNDPVALQFSQRINETDALRTGAYSKTLTFTLSTTNP